MNKNKIAVKFLSLMDGFENFYKIINRKLNANKFSKKFESLIDKKIKISKLISLEKFSKKLKSILNKKIQLPNWLTADSLSKSIRLLIQSKFDISSKAIDYKKSKKVKKERISIEKNPLVRSINSLVLSLKMNTEKVKNIRNRLLIKPIEKISIYAIFPKLPKNINLNRRKKKRSGKIHLDKKSQTIAVAFFSDHLLKVARISINSNNQILVIGVVEVPIPGHIIGDNYVEDTSELANIILDLFNLLDLDQEPLLVVLASSFFKVHTFESSELKQISNTDSTVQSNSPYLPGETFVEFLSMNQKSTKSKLLRTVYSRRKLIESWTDTLEIVNVPIIGLTPAAPHVFDALTSKLSDQLTILIDVEVTSTTVLIGRKLQDLNSHKLPYGCSLYISDQSYGLSDNYFNRVLSSVELILSEYDFELPSTIFVIGQGLDSLVNNDLPLPPNFKRFSDINLVDYSYAPKNMEIHELISKSIDSTIDILSLITSSCL